MVSMMRVRTVWSGFTGAPGYTNFYFRTFTGSEQPGAIPTQAEVDAAYDKTWDFWDTFNAVFPDEVALTVDTVVDIVEDTNGELVSSLTAPPQAIIQGAATGVYSAATGGVIGWTTAEVRNGRRIRGRTFLVPLGGTSFNNTGRLDASIVPVFQGAATVLAATGGPVQFGVWARPSGPNAVDGQWAPTTGARVTNLPAVLRSRRD